MVKISSQKDFESFLTLGTTTSNYTWNSTLQCIEINDASSSEKHCIEIPMGYVSKGDVIDIKFDFMKVSGDLCLCGLYTYTIPSLNTSYYNGTLAEYQLSNTDFAEHNIRFICKNSGYAKIQIGTNTATVAKYRVRNIRIDSVIGSCVNVYKNDGTNVSLTGVTSNGIKVQAGVVDVMLSSEGTKTMEVTFDEPFLHNKYVVVGNEKDNNISTFGQFNISTTPVDSGKFSITVVDINNTPRTGRVRVNYFAIGI